MADIVVEFGNALYQPILDRYIAGEPVPITELRQVWRNTTNVVGLWDAPVYERFIVAVRSVNQGLPEKNRLRVLAGDPPLDWSKVQRLEDAAPFLARDDHFASVLEKEVLNKGRKALIVLGGNHLYRRYWSGDRKENIVVNLIERRHPGSVFVILQYFAQMEGAKELEKRFSAWKIPALLPLKGTWLGAVSAMPARPLTRTRVGGGQTVREQVKGDASLHLQDLADALLYLGPLSTFTQSWPTLETYDPDYLRELQRRHQLLYGLPLDPKTLTR